MKNNDTVIVVVMDANGRLPKTKTQSTGPISLGGEPISLAKLLFISH
jgi:hypothetical protein